MSEGTDVKCKLHKFKLINDLFLTHNSSFNQN